MKVSCAAAVFQIKDLEASLQFYRNLLDFEEDFRLGDYAGIHLGGFDLHLCAHTTWKRPCGVGMVSVFSDEIDDYYAKVQSLGAKIELAPTDEPYGMRDFVVSDPDGNLLTFGCPLPAA